ncbi:Holliday junction branch migration protein RuvA [Pseudoleptotrichia goodfellowii]|jgi:Holliday junction DNA helicase, RuvA subunit|uniref:Holliday junction branch migration complex subunit RuvA n=1 Tax=Pseudoleptotrichia goodfellowii F0264 TaxID=596323 RepID=D0GJ52_9FUSO|nr:Holliday junction branch migration protein RuvA [Pseudoleptotrichia goodfellowii]EEY35880.1 Holliday junction DNA helicase RuvA [Pseudoleptotrichia goodfellowii F0264]MBF4805346.1 Holliday junction branch migration protein RuvA [Pseudoleptotrichia goodfellowii]
MFEYIFGELTVKKIDYVALDINGLAYKIFISLKTFEALGETGQDEKLYVHTHVKEDDISFYGFKTENERELFKALISTSGVGPKLGLAILSTYNVKDVINIVIESNSKLFTKVPGLGDKKAQKIILDLKDKVKKLNIIETYNENGEISKGNPIVSDTSNTKILLMKEDIKLALESLGYLNADVSKWIKDEELSQINDIGEAIKSILQKIQNKK